MPIYEYACGGCRKKVSIFQRSVSVAIAPLCPECGSGELSRQISKFSFHRSMSDFDDGSDLDGMIDDLDEDDPASVARWARRMGSQMGEDLPPGFEDDLARMETGDLPDDDFDDDSFD